MCHPVECGFHVLSPGSQGVVICASVCVLLQVTLSAAYLVLRFIRHWRRDKGRATRVPAHITALSSSAKGYVLSQPSAAHVLPPPGAAATPHTQGSQSRDTATHSEGAEADDAVRNVFTVSVGD